MFYRNALGMIREKTLNLTFLMNRVLNYLQILLKISCSECFIKYIFFLQPNSIDFILNNLVDIFLFCFKLVVNTFTQQD